MDGYQRRFIGAPGSIESSARETLDEAADFLRRLIPFPGAEVLSPLPLAAISTQIGAGQPNPVNATTDAAEEVASVVSQAASILDEEMARGVVAAQRSSGAPHPQSDPGSAVLHQMHEIVDNLAAIWPSLQGVAAPGSAKSQAAAGVDPVAELRPKTCVRPGQHATISMTVRNTENRAVHLVPAATDLLGSRGGRIPGALLEITPQDLRLESQEQKELSIATTVPPDAIPGCYSGLLVVGGVDYLRALVTIDVE